MGLIKKRRKSYTDNTTVEWTTTKDIYVMYKHTHTPVHIMYKCVISMCWDKDKLKQIWTVLQCSIEYLGMCYIHLRGGTQITNKIVLYRCDDRHAMYVIVYEYIYICLMYFMSPAKLAIVVRFVHCIVSRYQKASLA